MGNGQAPGTATGLGATGIETGVTGFGAGRLWEAGLAVFFFAAFFFAAFLTAGFLAGFFLVGAFLTALRTADFRDAFATGFFLPAAALRTLFVFDAFFFTDFFEADFFVDFAICASGICIQDNYTGVMPNAAARRPDWRDCGTTSPHPDARRPPT